MNRPGERISRALAAVLTTAVAAAVLTGCDGTGLPGDAKPSGSGSGSAPAAAGSGTSPLENPDGTKPGLAPLSSEQDRAAARRLIEKVTTKGRGPKTGYDRDRFGYAWMDTADGVPLARNGCDTRTISMLRSLIEAFSQRMRVVASCGN